MNAADARELDEVDTDEDKTNNMSEQVPTLSCTVRD